MSVERETNEHLFDMLANINSDFYAENKGAGHVSWQPSCFVMNNMLALDYWDMKKADVMSLVHEDFFDILFDAVAECDEILFDMCSRNA